MLVKYTIAYFMTFHRKKRRRSSYFHARTYDLIAGQTKLATIIQTSPKLNSFAYMSASYSARLHIKQMALSKFLPDMPINMVVFAATTSIPRKYSST
jgi:hypothetical protein